MTLWTIQSMAAWQALERDRVLVADRGYAPAPFLDAYRWMAGQMERRIGRGSRAASFPLWAWYQWRGTERRKPDLRASGHFHRGRRAVRIEFELSCAGVLLSDFMLWHYVLNCWYLPRTLADGEAFEAMKFPTARAFRRRMEDSWNRIFDLAWADEDIAEPYAAKAIQATFWTLHLDQVRDVKVFAAR